MTPNKLSERNKEKSHPIYHPQQDADHALTPSPSNTAESIAGDLRTPNDTKWEELFCSTTAEEFACLEQLFLDDENEGLSLALDRLT